jgi:hypothetical protein
MGHDRLLQSVREAPFLSAYHLAEWLAWNWWRLRWEPRKSSVEWELSHAMASIGNGYIWPNIHFLSDGRNISLVSVPAPERERTPYRYICDATKLISASDFEGEVDLFIETVLCRLSDYKVVDSNLVDIWQAVLDERQNAVLSQQRKIEALLGEDPGEMDEILLGSLLDGAGLTGPAALEEIAANRAPGQAVPNVEGLIERVRGEGVRVNQNDQIRLNVVSDAQDVPAWRLGANAAQSLRAELSLAPDQAISNEALADYYGAPASLLDNSSTLKGPDLSLSLAEPDGHSRVLLRSKWEAGRRFELARLLGDQLACDTSDPMRPATRSSTYRQKMQRAFAAELLSPFQAVDEMLAGDYSTENQQDVAHHFNVSDLTVSTLLVNHNRISRTELDDAY